MTIPTEMAALYNSRLPIESIAITARVPLEQLLDVIASDNPRSMNADDWARVAAVVNRSQYRKTNLKKSTGKYRQGETRTETVSRCLRESRCCLSPTEIKEKLGIPRDTINYVLREKLLTQGLVVKTPCNCRRNSRERVSKYDPKRPVACYRWVQV